MAEPDICFDTDDEECDGLLDLADALGDVQQEPQPQQAIPVAGGAPTQIAKLARAATAQKEVSRKTTQRIVKDHADGACTEPISGLRYRKPRLSSVDLASQLNDDATVRLDVALLRMQLPPDGGDRFNVVAVIGKREAKTAANGRTFLRWRLTDLIQSAALCLVFGDAAEAHMQLRVGTVIALRAPMWDNHGEGSLKVVEKGMAFEVGVAADFGTCAGVKRDGARCSMVVNTAVCRMCDWHLKQAASKIAHNTRPEFKGNALTTAYAPKARLVQTALSGKATGPTWQEKLGRASPKKRIRTSDCSLEKFATEMLEKRKSGGARAIHKFVQSQQDETDKRERKQREHARMQAVLRAPLGTTRHLSHEEAVRNCEGAAPAAVAAEPSGDAAAVAAAAAPAPVPAASVQQQQQAENLRTARAPASRSAAAPAAGQHTAQRTSGASAAVAQPDARSESSRSAHAPASRTAALPASSQQAAQRCVGASAASMPPDARPESNLRSTRASIPRTAAVPPAVQHTAQRSVGASASAAVAPENVRSTPENIRSTRVPASRTAAAQPTSQRNASARVAVALPDARPAGPEAGIVRQQHRKAAEVDLLDESMMRQASGVHVRAKEALADALRCSQANLASGAGSRAAGVAHVHQLRNNPLSSSGPLKRVAGSKNKRPGGEGGTQAKHARTGAARAAPAELSEFEKAFGSVTADVDDGSAHGGSGSGQGGDRLAALANDEEWRTIRARATVLAEQERTEERMANCVAMKVRAYSCTTCGLISEKRHPRCQSHAVDIVQTTKRWFKCNVCGGKSTTVGRRLPVHPCGKCKVNDWEACSMYTIKQDATYEDVLKHSGLADKSLLKVRGEERKWVNS